MKINTRVADENITFIKKMRNYMIDVANNIKNQIESEYNEFDESIINLIFDRVKDFRIQFWVKHNDKVCDMITIEAGDNWIWRSRNYDNVAKDWNTKKDVVEQVIDFIAKHKDEYIADIENESVKIAKKVLKENNFKVL